MTRNRAVFWKNLHSWEKFYTTAGRDGRDKFQVWLMMMMMMVCRRRRTQSGSLRALNFGFPTLRLAIIFIIIVIVTIIIVVVMAFGLFQSYRNPTMLGSPRTWALHKLYLSSTWELLARCLCLTVWGLLGNTWAPLGDCLVTTRPLLGDCLVIGAT